MAPSAGGASRCCPASSAGPVTPSTGSRSAGPRHRPTCRTPACGSTPPLGHGHYLAGVGIKRHDELGHEISVGTEPQARGQGLARRLVAQAARRILDQGRIPTYLHTFDNAASSRVAAAAGFPDLGWSALMLSDEPANVAAVAA
jgi:GNAT superfamily N-acetyltransferase